MQGDQLLVAMHQMGHFPFRNGDVPGEQTLFTISAYPCCQEEFSVLGAITIRHRLIYCQWDQSFQDILKPLWIYIRANRALLR